MIKESDHDSCGGCQGCLHWVLESQGNLPFFSIKRLNKHPMRECRKFEIRPHAAFSKMRKLCLTQASSVMSRPL